MSKIYEPKGKSQSPQAGQFNSYWETFIARPRRRHVSIPSSGSIQFLPYLAECEKYVSSKSQSPQAGQFNSYRSKFQECFVRCIWSQSPQAGQFNSYTRRRLDRIRIRCRVSIPSSGSIQFLPGTSR